jgi:hypothetical protein
VGGPDTAGMIEGRIRTGTKARKVGLYGLVVLAFPSCR